jgi:hypothetical protein
MVDPDPWTCKLSCKNPVLTGEYIERTSRAQYDQGVSVYERRASNTKVPAEVTISFWKSAQQNVEVTSKASHWKLYYKTEPPADKKKVMFICGTEFTLTDPDKDTGSVNVTGCTIDASFNGDYTQVPDTMDDGNVIRRYTRSIGASSPNKIPSYVTCNWARKSFGIEILAYSLIVGPCTRVNIDTSNITLKAAVTTTGDAKDASIILTSNALCRYVPFGIITPDSSTRSGFTFWWQGRDTPSNQRIGAIRTGDGISTHRRAQDSLTYLLVHCCTDAERSN